MVLIFTIKVNNALLFLLSTPHDQVLHKVRRNQLYAIITTSLMVLSACGVGAITTAHP
jgi:hypothetical protein